MTNIRNFEIRSIKTRIQCNKTTIKAHLNLP